VQLAQSFKLWHRQDSGKRLYICAVVDVVASAPTSNFMNKLRPEMPRATTRKKHYPRFKAYVGEAAALQVRIVSGEATPDEAQQYDKIMREFRRKFANGQLSPLTARQFGIE
jgi:hypothetical protein